MVEENKTKIEKEEKKETKKLDDVKDTPENKTAIAESEGKVEAKEEKKEESKPAVGKVSKKEKKTEAKIELEREYVVPLKRGVLNVPHYRRAKKAIKVLKEFMVRHMNVRDGDLGKVKIDVYLNNELWFRGIKKPANKIRVKAKKVDGVVYVELAEVPETVKFAMARDKKRSDAAGAVKVKAPKKDKKEDKEKDKDGDGVDDKKEEEEDAKSGAEKAAKIAKVKAKEIKHTATGKHMKKTMPVRKVLK